MMGIVQRNILDPVQPVVAEVTYRGKHVTFGGPAYIGMYTWCEHTVVDQQMLVKLDKDVATDVTSHHRLRGAGRRWRGAEFGSGARGAVGRGLRRWRRRAVDRPGVRQLRAPRRSSSST